MFYSGIWALYIGVPLVTYFARKSWDVCGESAYEVASSWFIIVRLSIILRIEMTIRNEWETKVNQGLSGARDWVAELQERGGLHLHVVI
jgi:hypothetical protein